MASFLDELMRADVLYFLSGHILDTAIVMLQLYDLVGYETH